MIVKIVVRTAGSHRKPRRTSDISGLVRGNEFALTLKRSTLRFLVEVKQRGGRSSRSRANANERIDVKKEITSRLSRVIEPLSAGSSWFSAE